MLLTGWQYAPPVVTIKGNVAVALAPHAVKILWGSDLDSIAASLFVWIG